MSVTMYKASVPVLIHNLENLIHILNKGAAWAKAKGVDDAVMLNYRIAPDMFPLVRQVQIATDVAKGAGARLSGREPPKYADDETTVDALIKRVRKTISYLKQVKPRQVDGSEDSIVTLNFPGMTMHFEGWHYLQGFVMPNVYFHVTTAYDILRHCGVDVGKMDFLGKIPQAKPKKTAAKKPAGKKAKKKAKKKKK